MSVLSYTSQAHNTELQGKWAHKPKAFKGSKYSKLNLNTGGNVGEATSTLASGNEQTAYLPVK